MPLVGLALKSATGGITAGCAWINSGFSLEDIPARFVTVRLTV